jgi:acyl carrier protein
MNDNHQRLVSCFTTVFPKLSEKDAASASVTSVEGWDSLATVTLITVVQEEFGTPVDPEDIEQFASFRQILQFLDDKGAPKRS